LPVCIQIVKNARPECTGICRIVTGLAKSTADFGYETSVLFLGAGPLEDEVREQGIRAGVVSWDGSRGDLVGAWKVLRWLRKHRADIVHSHHGGLMVRAVCRAGGVSAVVQHIHSRILENKQDGKISDLSFTAADAVIASSQAVADCLPRCRAEVVYAGLETGPWPPPVADRSGAFKLGVLTRLIPLKNVEALLSATALLRDQGIDVETEIAGSGPSEPSLRSLASTLGIMDRVRFLGWRPDIRGLLASWNILVIPSNEESFPITALEAMAAARPIVASRVGGLAELVVDGVTGRLIAPGNIEKLAGSIAELICDPNLADQMGMEGWKRVKDHFSINLMASRTAAIYNHVLHPRSVRAT
jgi:glycosyltransferase involved in cell wall biosynthesis